MNTKEINERFFKLSKEQRETVVHMVIGGLRIAHNQEVNDAFELMMDSLD